MGFRKLAFISTRYPKTILLAWVLFLVFFGWDAPKLSGVVKDHGLTPNGSSARVQRMLSADFGIPEDPVILVFAKEPFVSEPAFRGFIAQTLERLRGIEGLGAIASPLDRDGMLRGDFAYAWLAFRQRAYEMKPVVDEIRRRLPQSREITVKMTGKSVVQTDVNRASRRDLTKAEWAGIPAALIILRLAFGGFVSAMIPVAAGMIGVAGTMGVMARLGTRMELSNFVLDVIPMVGLALSLFRPDAGQPVSRGTGARRCG